MFVVLKHSTFADKSSKTIGSTAGVSGKQFCCRLFFVLGTALFFSILSITLFAQDLTPKQNKMIRDFESAAQKINRSLPTRTGDITVSRVEVGPGLRFTNYYIVHGEKNAERPSVSQFARTTEKVTAETACKDREFLKAIRQGMVFHYVYKAVDGSTLTHFVVDQARCR